MPPRSTRRSERWTGGEERGGIAAPVTVVLVLLLGVSRAACVVAASDSWPPIGVAPYAGSSSGPLSETPWKRTVVCTKASLKVALWPVRWCCVPNSEAAFRPSAPASVKAGGRPPRTLSTAEATEHRPSRTPWPEEVAGSVRFGPLSPRRAAGRGLLTGTRNREGGSVSGTQVKMDAVTCRRRPTIM
jgi:hypothetical protein